MAHVTLPDPPSQTPMFSNLDVKELLRGPGKLFRFMVGAVWVDWFGLVTEICAPLIVKATLNFPDTAAQTSSDLTVTVAGAETDHHAEVIPPTTLWPANCSWVAFVSAANVVTVRFVNVSAAAINPASGTFVVIVRK